MYFPWELGLTLCRLYPLGTRDKSTTDFDPWELGSGQHLGVYFPWELGLTLSRLFPLGTREKLTFDLDPWELGSGRRLEVLYL